MAWEVEDSLLMRDLDLLHPVFIPAAKGLVETAKHVGLSFKVWETLRDHRRQAAYYGRGREMVDAREGKWRVVNPELVITNAGPGESPHEFGLALDLVLDIPGVNPWAGVKSYAEHRGLIKPSRERLELRRRYEPKWRQLSAIALELGVTSGYRHWGWDWPHFQMKRWTDYRPDGYRDTVAFRLEEGVEGD